ncbi:MAG: inositol monophosphatase [Patescibacteria group bacterium]
MNNRDITDRLRVARVLAEQAGQALLVMREKSAGRRQSKEGEGFVTEADLESERIILNGIRDAFPNDEILSEESAPKTFEDYEKKSALWVVDPLDGTSNYLFGLHNYGVSIAFVSNGVPLVGVICLPSHGLIFFGRQEEIPYALPLSASDEEVRRMLRVARETDPNKAMLHHGWSYPPEGKRRTLRYMERLVDFLDIRSEGCVVAGLLSVARGHGHAYVQETLKPWDVAAAGLLVRLAGGVVTGMDGTPWHPFRHDIVASNGDLHPLLLQRLSGWEP